MFHDCDDATLNWALTTVRLWTEATADVLRSNTVGSVARRAVDVCLGNQGPDHQPAWARSGPSSDIRKTTCIGSGRVPQSTNRWERLIVPTFQWNLASEVANGLQTNRSSIEPLSRWCGT
jgi:hypothetical protein